MRVCECVCVCVSLIALDCTEHMSIKKRDK